MTNDIRLVGHHLLVERPTKNKPGWFGLDSLHSHDLRDGLVPPGHHFAIQRTIYTTFKGERLLVKRDCASSFLIHNVFVANMNSRSTLHDAIFAEPFAVDFGDLPKISLEIEEAAKLGKTIEIKVDRLAVEVLGMPWPLPALQPGLPLTFAAECIGKEPVRFIGAFFGQTSE